MFRTLFRLFFLVIPCVSSAQYIHIGASSEEVILGDKVSYYRDTTRLLSVDEVTHSDYTNKFVQSEKRVFNFQTTTDAIWIKQDFVCDKSGTYFLRVSPPLIDSLTFYFKNASGWNIEQGGYDAWRLPRSVEGPCWVFHFQGECGDTVSTMLRVQTDMPFIFLMYAGDAITTGDVISEQSVLNGIYLGIMLMMIIYNMFLFITNRQRVYLHYSLYTFFATLFVVYASGAAITLPEWVGALHSFSLAITPGMFGIFGMTFTRDFLVTQKYFKRFDRWMMWLSIFVIVTVVCGFFDRMLSGTLIQLTGGLFTVFVIYTGFRILRAGYKPAIYYVCGVSTYMLFLLVYIVFGVTDVDTGNFQPFYLLMIGSALEAIILSFAIGDKLNSANRQKLEADQATMKAVQENERIVREQNVMLEKKVSERTEEIQHQKSIIEEKNKDILDSIHYAKRIQATLLASDSLLKKNLNDYFILYKPKDIVSGDFYFGAEQGDKFWLCVGDCTGHGVPGAFMSLLNISFLRELIVDQKIQNPDTVLNKQRDAIIGALNPDGTLESAKDGMDCALLRFDRRTNELEFACANNPLWIMRNGELIEFRGDKQPVGLHEGTIKQYSLHKLKLEQNDVIYAFTDGFADQFGGSKGKKFKYAQLKEVITKVHNLPMEEQQTILDRTFNQWRGDLQQVDDVLLVGISLRNMV